MFIPAICASYGNVGAVTGCKVNYYIGNGVSAKKSYSISREYQEIVDSGCEIIMVHAIISKDIGDFYNVNKPYYEMLRKLGKIGLTIHFRMPKNHVEENLLFSEFLRIHKELPEAILYLENEYFDLYGTLTMVMSLRALNIKAWMLLDTCHLEMDASRRQLNDDWKKNKADYGYLFETYKDFIGAFHISASKGAEGFAHETHGKPILSKSDEAFFKNLCKTITDIDFGHDVILIPEVTEERYGKRCNRINGKYAIRIIERIINEKETINAT